jgi:hypothetical protein
MLHSYVGVTGTERQSSGVQRAGSIKTHFRDRSGVQVSHSGPVAGKSGEGYPSFSHAAATSF